MKSKLFWKESPSIKDSISHIYLDDAETSKSLMEKNNSNDLNIVTDRQFIIGRNQKDGKEITVPIKALNKGMTVLGNTGSGKTVLCKVICEKTLQEDIPVIVIDSQGDLASMAMNISHKSSKIAPEKMVDIDYLNNRVEKFIYTPQSTSGIPISANPFNVNPEKFYSSNPIKHNQAIDYLATIVLNHMKGLPKIKLPFFQGALSKIIKYTLKKDKLTNLNDLAGTMYNMSNRLKKDIKKNIDENQFDLLKRSFQTLLDSSDRYFFDFGIPLDFDFLLGRVHNPENKTRLSILYLNSISNQTSKEDFISIFIETLYNWMLKNPIKENGSPQLVLFIDEIGQYIPPQNQRKPSCKDGIIKFKKQARKYGIAMIDASQSPGDFDYLALGQSNSIVIGRLKTKQDFKRVEQMVQGDFIENPEEILPSLQTGEFILVAPDVSVEPLRLNTDNTLFNHCTLTEKEFEQIIPNKLRTQFNSTPRESKQIKTTRVDHPSLRESKQNPFSLGCSDFIAYSKENSITLESYNNNIDESAIEPQEYEIRKREKKMKSPSRTLKKYIIPIGMMMFICLSIFFLSSQIGAIYGHFRNIFGPAFIGLLGLTILFVTSLFRIFFKKPHEEMPLTSLIIVQYAGPTVGLLGTIISIQGGFGDLNLGSVELDIAINQITKTLGVSLSTTVYGMVLSLFAMIVRLLLDRQKESEPI